MIEKILLRNFYSHISTELMLKQLNIFIGRNNSGKSNIFKAITHLKQIILSDFQRPPQYLFPLNFKRNAQDLIRKQAKGNIQSVSEIKIIGKTKEVYLLQYPDDQLEYELKLQINLPRIDTFVNLKHKKGEGSYYEYSENLHAWFDFQGHQVIESNLSLKLPDIIDDQYSFHNIYENEIPTTFIDRIKLKGFNNFNPALNRPYIFSKIGKTFNYILKKFPYNKEEYELQKRGYNPETDKYIELVEMDEILSALKYNEELLPNLNKALKNIFNEKISFTVQLSEGRKLIPSINMRNNSFSLFNVAQSIQEFLEIVVKILLTPEESLIYIDEPEIHIEIDNQGKLIETLYEICKKRNSQLIIATHSEHILYALSAMCKRKQIQKQDLAIFSFEYSEKEQGTKVKEIKLNEQYALEDMPGFKECFQKEFENTIEEKKEKIRL